ncbi:unnamed protein product [Durusdinium trenchii]|uniref:Uncharacterized protein n=1 Tax=Durusdinium trenchii TaxID=1381693 RepID=A0ABP0HCD2_9DINO
MDVQHLSKLDAVRGHYNQELHSCVAFGDLIRFLLWLMAGAILQSVSQEWFHQSYDHRNLLSDPLWWIVSMAMCAVFVAVSMKIWWLLSLSMGGLSCLLISNLSIERQWRGCRHEYVEIAYVMTQRFAAVLGPFAAWWVTWTSQAMDRVIEEPPLKASGCSRCASFFFGFGRRHQYHHGRLGCCGRRDRPALRLHINEDSECFFFRDDGCGHLRLHHNSFSSDSAASEDESDSSSEESFFAQEGKMVTLIYSRSGDHLTCRLQHLDHLGPNAGQLIFTANEEEDKKALRILKSDQPLLIYSPMQGGSGVLLHRGGGCIQTRVDRLVGMQDAALQKYCCCNLHCALALCLFLIMYAFALCIGGTGYPGYAAIVFLLLPELVDDFLPNATTSPSKSHLYDGKLDTEIKVTFNQGWTCVSGADQSGKDYMIEFSALWAATFILACCTISLIYGCYYLHNASDFLGMLNDLLWRRAGANYRTWRLRKLHSIRSSVENKRFLEFSAQGSLPGLTIEDDDELQWWVDTRAALFEDIRFNLEKRKPILGLCLLAELMLIVVTILSLLLHENDFALTCYAVTYGCALGILTLLCIFLCSQVNEKLRHCTSIMRGTEDAEEDVPREDMPRASLLLGTEPQQHAFLNHERSHPLQLKFLGFPLNFNVFKIYAAPMAGYLVTLACWFAQQLVQPFFQFKS